MTIEIGRSDPRSVVEQYPGMSGSGVWFWAAAVIFALVVCAVQEGASGQESKGNAAAFEHLPGITVDRSGSSPVIVAGFEDGTLEPYPIRKFGVDNTDKPYGLDSIHPAIRVVDAPDRAGSKAIRFHIEKHWDFSDVNSVRVECNWAGDNPVQQALYREGWCRWRKAFWHSFSFYVPEDWQADALRESIHEFHRNGPLHPDVPPGAGKPLTTNVYGRYLTFINDYHDRDGQYHRDRIQPIRIRPGQWYDIVLHIKWSHHGDDTTGFMRIWVNEKQVYNHQGNTAIEDGGPPRAPKFGIYKWDWAAGEEPDPLDDSQHASGSGQADLPLLSERTYYFDELRFGFSAATFQDMVPAPHR